MIASPTQPSALRRRLPLLALLLVVAALSSVVTVYALVPTVSRSIREPDCSFDLIDQSACNDDVPAQLAYEAFRVDLVDELAAAKKRGAVTEAAIRFRDLENGPAFIINEDKTFLPMSLLKLPLLLSVLKFSEAHPEALQERLHTPAFFAQNVQVMSTDQTVRPDTEYTVEELLRYMIVYSDNRALGMLSAWIETKGGHQTVVRTLVDLGLMRPKDATPSVEIGVKTYSALFRILYTASYLSPERSQHALGLLTQTAFSDGITHDVPEGVRVAHKFGVRDDGGAEVQLHDCGIVYHPVSPYILCIMTKGTSYDAQAAYVQQVAREIYTEVSRRGAQR